MKTAIFAATSAASALFATAALATGQGSSLCVQGMNIVTNQPCGTAVPEISALEGTAALAALAAIVLIAWERRRRAA